MLSKHTVSTLVSGISRWKPPRQAFLPPPPPPTTLPLPPSGGQSWGGGVGDGEAGSLFHLSEAWPWLPKGVTCDVGVLEELTLKPKLQEASWEHCHKLIRLMRASGLAPENPCCTPAWQRETGSILREIPTDRPRVQL